MKKHLTILIALLIFNACSKNEMPEYQQQIVVDGWIEQDQYAKVLLSKSAAYLSDVDSISIRQLAVTRAKVTVSDGLTSEILTLIPNTDYFPPYVYQTTQMKGKVGETYTLEIFVEGQYITAQTSIPEPVELDTAFFERLSPTDTIGFLKGRFTDNPNTKNYYRLHTKRLGTDKRFFPTYIPNYDDDLFAGESFEFNIYKGNTNWLEREDNIYYNVGDKITIKVSTLNKNTYNYWLSVQSELQNVGNPLASSSAKIITNLSSGIGFWAGYGVSYKTVVAQ